MERVEIETFDVAYNIIGGEEEGEKTIVRTKEEADHSLPYMVAVALLDKLGLVHQGRRSRKVDPIVLFAKGASPTSRRQKGMLTTVRRAAGPKPHVYAG